VIRQNLHEVQDEIIADATEPLHEIGTDVAGVWIEHCSTVLVDALVDGIDRLRQRNAAAHRSSDLDDIESRVTDGGSGVVVVTVPATIRAEDSWTISPSCIEPTRNPSGRR
jgi:hypothetical protein